MVKRWYNPNEGEKKTRQVSLICKPSTYEALQKSAYVKEVSANHLICKILEEWVEKHQDLVDLYDKQKNN